MPYVLYIILPSIYCLFNFFIKIKYFYSKKMEFFLLIFFSYINFIFAESQISEIQKIKVRACIKLQSKKYKEEEEKVTHYLEYMSKELNSEPRQIMYIVLSICTKIIPEQYARVIHKTSGDLNLNKNNTLLNKIYNFEYYNFDDIEFIKTAYKEFLPAFEVVKEEIKNQKEYYKGVYFEFTKKPLFRLFFIYFIINTIIIFYRRIKYPPIINNNIQIEKEENNNSKEEKKKKNKHRKEKKE